MNPCHPTAPLLQSPSTRHSWFLLYPFPNGSDSCSLPRAGFQFPHAEVSLHSLLQSQSQACLGRAAAMLPGHGSAARWVTLLCLSWALTGTLGDRKEGTESQGSDYELSSITCGRACGEGASSAIFAQRKLQLICGGSRSALRNPPGRVRTQGHTSHYFLV